MNDKFFTGWFVVCAVLGVAWVAFLAWVIVRVVGWLVTK